MVDDEASEARQHALEAVLVLLCKAMVKVDRVEGARMVLGLREIEAVAQRKRHSDALETIQRILSNISEAVDER